MDDQQSAPELSVPLFTFSDSIPDAVSEQELVTFKNWSLNWLSKANADLGRKGPVCPFTGTSIAKDIFRFTFVRGQSIDHNELVQLIDEIAQAFPRLSPFGADEVYKTVVVVFPDVVDHQTIDAVQEECKNTFVKSGLMVGQFYPGHTQPGIWNPEFRPLDSPFPMLAVRHMVTTDFLFLQGDQEWMDAYFARFAPDIPSHVRVEIIGRIQSADTD